MSFYKFLVPKIEKIITIIHTYDEEISKIIGKNTEEYRNNTAICIFSEDDINELGIKENTNVKINTKWGSVVLKAVKSQYTKKGVVLIPMGIWACQIIPSDIQKYGQIKYRNFKGFIESTDEKIKSYEELKNIFS